MKETGTTSKSPVQACRAAPYVPLRLQIKAKDLIDETSKLGREEFYEKTEGMSLRDITMYLDNIVRAARKATSNPSPDSSDSDSDSECSGPIYDIQHEIRYFRNLKLVIEENQSSYEQNVSLPSKEEIHSSTLIFDSLLDLGHKYATAAKNSGLKHLICAFKAGWYLQEAQTSDKKQFAKLYKGTSSKQRSYQRYMKFYRDLKDYPMLALIDNGLEKVTNDAKKLHKLETANGSEAAKKAVNELVRFFKEELPDSMFVSFS